eukprot:CAMPEP_0113539094 /NCGR_PEP_ID=MMETSP0015_2-20120614/7732_1 /TAXON_ID=2838 /ORGANISM="Odontella" /LENGTH=684 /DNA_ID=CAMNT_0000438745 /DNA_START=81 /DNA_END=2135 /DNA_ORIENTATION=- /assembly_acc=CAM_ASM_000160
MTEQNSGSMLGGMFGFGGGGTSPVSSSTAGGGGVPSPQSVAIATAGTLVIPESSPSSAEDGSSPTSSSAVPAAARDAVGASRAKSTTLSNSVAVAAVGASASGTSPSPIPSSSLMPVLETESTRDGGDDAMSVAASVATAAATNVTVPAPAMHEVDYDVNVTSLYKNLESRHWDKSIEFLENESDESILAACSTWVLRKEKNGKLRWRLLPIHGAIMFGAPLHVVESLLEAFPYGARCKDDQGMLPLHLAFRNDAPDNIVTELLRAHPPSIRTKDRKGRLPLGCALSAGAAKKSRAKLIDAYANETVRMERERASVDVDSQYRRRVDDLQSRQANDADRVKKSFEASLMSNVEKITRLESDNARLRRDAAEGSARLSEKERSESELTDKVRDLTKALEAMTQMKRAESARYETELESFQSTRDDLLRKLEGVTVVASERDRARSECAQETVQKDILRSSMNDLIENHRLCVDERDDLLRRNDELTALLERVRADQEGMNNCLAKLEQDTNASAVVRERMMAALAKQEHEAAGLAEREYDALRGVLDRQGGEVDDALSAWGAGADVGPTPHPRREGSVGGGSHGGGPDHHHQGMASSPPPRSPVVVAAGAGAGSAAPQEQVGGRGGGGMIPHSASGPGPSPPGAPRDIYISRSYNNQGGGGGRSPSFDRASGSARPASPTGSMRG